MAKVNVDANSLLGNWQPSAVCHSDCHDRCNGQL